MRLYKFTFNINGEFWYLNCLRHRDDGSAVIYHNGTQVWYLNNKLHREGGPAVIYYNEKKEWYKNGAFIK